MKRVSYWRRLSRHPGVPDALFLTFVTVIAAPHESAIPLLLVVNAVWWVPVLWTARTQPVPEDEDD